MSPDRNYLDWVLYTLPVGITVRASASEDGKSKLHYSDSFLLEVQQAVERSVTLAASGGTVTITGEALPISGVFIRADAAIDINIGTLGGGLLEDCSFAYMTLYGADTSVVLTNNSSDPVSVQIVLLKE